MIGEGIGASIDDFLNFQKGIARHERFWRSYKLQRSPDL